MIRSIFMPVVMACLGLISGVAAQAEIVLQDNFSLEDGRKAGDPLCGQKIEHGVGLWQGEKTAILSEDESATLAETQSGSAWLALEAAPESICLEAVVDSSGSDWTCLALGGKWGNAFYDTTALWVMLKPSGEFQVRAKGTKLILKSGKIPHMASGGNRVALVYGRKGNAYSVTINDELIMDKYPLDEKGFTPIIGSAGFRFNGPIGTGKKPSIKSFRLTMVPVPTLALKCNQSLSVYAPGEPIKMTLVGAGLPDAKVKARAIITDFYGQPAGEKQWEVKAEGGTVRQEFSAPDSGKLGFFSMHVELVDGQGVVLISAENSFVVIPQPKEGDNLFGAMVYPHLAYPIEDKERDVQYMKRIGVTYVRTGRLNWVHAQASKEAPIAWDDLDREVDLYARYKLKIIATTAWPIPTWASPAVNTKDGVDRGNFLPREDCMPLALQFMREMVARYRDKIACYEIGNETDAYFWLGSLEHYYAHDTKGILRDYCDYFSALADEIHAVDPQALIAPSTTSHIPEGHMYQPWLKTVLDFGLGSKMSALATHYDADMDAINAILREYRAEKPVFITEIGGISRKSLKADSNGSAMKEIIRGDYLQMSRKLASKNVKALCKFIFREQSTYGGEGNLMAGLLGPNFELRPTYVAYATLIRQLAGADYVKELNVTRDTSQGWLQGVAFARGGQAINLLFLHAAEKATVTLITKEAQLKWVDVMGNEEPLSVKDGKATIEMTKALPVIILGKLEDKNGVVQRPADNLVREVEITLENPGFEAEASLDKIPGWRRMVNEDGASNLKGGKFSVNPDHEIVAQGKQSVRFDAPELTQWFGLSQEIPLALIPKPAADEYLVFKVSAMVKGSKVNGKGMGYTLAFRKADMTRLYFMGSPYFGFGGTFDWRELSGSHQLREWVPGTERLTLDLLMGKATGTLWLDQVKVSIQLWKTAN